MDIIFFAALAFYIFYKLSKQLGNITEEEKEEIARKISQREQKIKEIQQQLTANIQKTLENDIQNNSTAETEIFNGLDEKLIQTLKEIFAKCNISAQFFVNGVKSAFEMILKAFAAQDHDTLKFLVSEKIYEGFKKAIEQRQLGQKTLHSNIISIQNAEILSAGITGNNGFVTVKITSKQINYFTDKDNNIVEGAKDDIATLTDIWTFSKDLTSPNPNWQVSTTG